jgi:hypothetical protein
MIKTVMRLEEEDSSNETHISDSTTGGLRVTVLRQESGDYVSIDVGFLVNS